MATQVSQWKNSNPRHHPNQISDLFGKNKCPAFKTAIILAAGIIVGYYSPFHLVPYYTSASTCLILSLILLWNKKSKTGLFLLILSLFLSGISFIQSSRDHPQHHISHLALKSTVTLRGYVCQSPKQKYNRTQFTLKILSLLGRNPQPVCGKMMVYVYHCPKDSFQYGDELILQGQFIDPPGQRNPGGFNFRAYLERQGIHKLFRVKQNQFQKTGRQLGNPILRQWINPVRRYALRIITQNYKGYPQLLLKAFILGERTEMPTHLYEQFSKTGIAHVLAVSGLHVGFILIALSGFFTLLRIPYPVKIILIIIGLGFFTLLTESRPSVFRAFLMTSLYLLGMLFERKPNPVNIIGLSALVSLSINPASLFDLGFQLSYTAVLAIVIGYPHIIALPPIKKISEKLIHHRFFYSLFLIGLVSVSAQLGTIPLTAFYFNRISLISIILNIFAIPLTGIVVVIGFTSLLLNLIHPSLILILSFINQWTITFIILLTRFATRLPFSSIPCPKPDFFQIIFYISLLILLYKWQFQKWRKKLVFIALISINISIMEHTLLELEPRLELIQFDVGYGDAALLKLPRGKHILIDGGSKNPTFDNGQSVIAPFLRQSGIKKLDAVFLTHAHNDHIGGLNYMIKHFDVSQLIVSDTLVSSTLLKDLLRLTRSEKIPIHIMTDSDTLLFPGIRIQCLSNPKIALKKSTGKSINLNNTSLVLKICFGKTSFLFMGDAEQLVENQLISNNKNLKSNVIKIAHHGSKTSSTLYFLKRVHPDHAIVSVGQSNRWGHPSPSVIQRLKKMNILLHRTDENGAIVLQSNGEHIRVINWRKKS